MRNAFKFIYPTLILAAICLIVSLALSSTNLITKERIAKIEDENTKKAMSRVIKADKYTEKAFDDGKDKVSYYEAVKDNKTVGLVFITGANGYGGTVRVMTAVLPDKTVKAVEILDVSGETPGLGQNAAKKEFYRQFSGLSGEISVLKNNADSDNNEINAIAGATITSRAVTKSVNEALALADKIMGEGEKNEK